MNVKDEIGQLKADVITIFHRVSTYFPRVGSVSGCLVVARNENELIFWWRDYPASNKDEPAKHTIILRMNNIQKIMINYQEKEAYLLISSIQPSSMNQFIFPPESNQLICLAQLLSLFNSFKLSNKEKNSLETSVNFVAESYSATESRHHLYEFTVEKDNIFIPIDFSVNGLISQNVAYVKPDLHIISQFKVVAEDFTKNPILQSELTSFKNFDELREAVKNRGVDPSIRHIVWPIIYKILPFDASKREEVLKSRVAEYISLRNQWKTMSRTQLKYFIPVCEAFSTIRVDVKRTHLPEIILKVKRKSASSNSDPNSNTNSNTDSNLNNNSNSNPNSDSNSNQNSNSNSNSNTNPNSDSNSNQNTNSNSNSNSDSNQNTNSNSDSDSNSNSDSNSDSNSNQNTNSNSNSNTDSNQNTNTNSNSNSDSNSNQNADSNSNANSNSNASQSADQPLNPWLETLTSVLRTFSLWNLNVRYTQGLNDLVVNFMSIFSSMFENSEDEAEALTFWCFASFVELNSSALIAENLMDKQSLELPKIMEIIEKFHPACAKWLRSSNVGDLSFLISSFILAYGRSFSQDSIARIWETLICVEKPWAFLRFFSASLIILSFPSFLQIPNCSTGKLVSMIDRIFYNQEIGAVIGVTLKMMLASVANDNENVADKKKIPTPTLKSGGVVLFKPFTEYSNVYESDKSLFE